MWEISCYHFEKKKRFIQEHDPKGGTRTRVVYDNVRVDTHSNTEYVRYPGCVDASPILSGVEQYRMTRIYNSLKIAFASAGAKQYFERRRQEWIRTNDRDEQYNFEEKDVLPGLKSHFLTFNGPKKKFPPCLKCCCLVVLSVLMLDWILIFWFMRHSARLDYKYFKIATDVSV